MTREEAITLIKSALKTMYLPKSKEYISDLGYALEIAIKALEQEPILDKIKSYIDHIRNTGMGKKKSLEFIEKFIDGLKEESEG